MLLKLCKVFSVDLRISIQETIYLSVFNQMVHSMSTPIVVIYYIFTYILHLFNVRADIDVVHYNLIC